MYVAFVITAVTEQRGCLFQQSWVDIQENRLFFICTILKEAGGMWK